MMKLPFINRIFPSYRSRIVAVIIGGIIVGGGALFMYMLRAHTYLGDDPAACVNCHIMSPYYATWFHSSHARDATCNDCHVPHENIVKKWTFKGMDGMKHVAAFLAKSEPQVIQAHEASSQVIMNNCIRCHTQLNTEFVKTGKIDYMMSMDLVRSRGLGDVYKRQEKERLAGTVIGMYLTVVRIRCPLLRQLSSLFPNHPYRNGFGRWLIIRNKHMHNYVIK